MDQGATTKAIAPSALNKQPRSPADDPRYAAGESAVAAISTCQKISIWQISDAVRRLTPV